MRINSSKSIAALMAVCVGTLSSVTAMAAPNVTTYTTYDISDTTNKSISVVTEVSGATPDSQVTFLVAKPNVTSGSDIVFIDQKKATNGSVDFEFSAPQNSMYADNLTVNVKLGTNGSENVFPTFTFTEGLNYYGTNVDGQTAPSVGSTTGAVEDSVLQLLGASNTKTIKFAKLQGNASGMTYGVVDTDSKVEYRAYGCGSDGTYCVIIDGKADLSLEPYVK